MARYLACIEMRPLPSGVWYYEDHRATYEGEVEVTLYHPNPLARVRPRRFRIPIIYTLHVPPFYTYHGPPQTRPARRFHSFRFRTATRSHPSAFRVVREETPTPRPMSPVHGTPSADPVPRGGTPTRSEEVEEDPEEGESEGEPVEYSTGSQWGVGDPPGDA